MNLKRLKLLSDYKIFKRNLEFNFNDSKILAIVGANGSGKSIFQSNCKCFCESICQIK